MHKKIIFKNINVVFGQKTCFENFSSEILYQSRIGIIGRNGSGKTSLLNIIESECQAQRLTVSYVHQILDESSMSGGEKLKAAITEALSISPDVLLLDEPTNHLDQRNRNSLIRMLEHYSDTLIIASHDTELLRRCTDELWHIENGVVKEFIGRYEDYISEVKLKRASVERELQITSRQKKEMHNKLMQEQQRIAKSKAKGIKSIKNLKWPGIGTINVVNNSQEAQAKKIIALDKAKETLLNKLEELRLPEVIIPKFSIDSSDKSGQVLVKISNGSTGYSDNHILSKINLTLHGGDRIAITGDNGSGKSTLFRGIMGLIPTSGAWNVTQELGYLDQNYNTLDPDKSPFETIAELMPHWSNNEVRSHLSDFLFRKNEEVNSLVQNLSGGEKVRLSLAQIAARTPRLLLLDEITNNLDLETKEHVAQVLKSYPGGIIIISHEPDFLEQIGIRDTISIEDFK